MKKKLTGHSNTNTSLSTTPNANVSSLSNTLTGQQLNSIFTGNSQAGSYTQTINTIGYSQIAPQKTSYFILGREIKIEGYKDMNLAMLITNININGIEFYIEFKKQFDSSEIHINEEVTSFLENELTSYKRNKGIDKIIN
jgi:hypothetical protein